MKKKTNKLVLVLFSLLISLGTHAQIKQIGSMLSGSVSDAEKLMQAYLKPYGNAFGADLNGGWYSTAKPHKLLGFDLTASISAAFVPKADKEFDASKLGLVGIVSPQNSISPTVAGSKDQGQTITYASVGGLNYKTPQGTNWGVIPAPMFQLGIGLVKESDITIRYVPKLNIKDIGSVGMWGIGLKHSIKQYIPGIKMAPFFHLSVFLGYTKMSSSANLSFAPTDYNSLLPIAPTIATGSMTFDNQKMEMIFKGFTGNILASFDLPVVTFYGGIGLATTSTNLKLTGNYPFPNANGTQIIGKADPINIKMSSSSGSVTKPRLNLGITFKMAIIHLHFDYTYANYSVVTAGLGISFR